MLLPDSVASFLSMEPRCIPEPEHSSSIFDNTIFPEITISSSPNADSHISMVASSMDGINNTTTTPVCKFVCKKEDIEYVNPSGLIVQQIEGAIDCPSVLPYASGARHVTIQDSISNVRESHGDPSSALWQGVCLDCKNDPCILFGYAHCIQAIGDHLCNKGSTNCEVQYKLYCKMAILIFGKLGQGNCRPLANCVVNCIRAAFPNTNKSEEYVGYCKGSN